MSDLETPRELAEQIADWCGVYGGCIQEEGTNACPDEDNVRYAGCRICFTDMVERRIRSSVTNEALADILGELHL